MSPRLRREVMLLAATAVFTPAIGAADPGESEAASAPMEAMARDFPDGFPGAWILREEPVKALPAVSAGRAMDPAPGSLRSDRLAR